MKSQGNLFPGVSKDMQEAAEAQIRERQKETDFDIREYPVEIIVLKFTELLENDKAELFIPDYQRELVWSEPQQARFIESILLNLPIPYLYVADVADGENEGRIEVVDGSQRIRTLVRFMEGELELDKLEVLNKLNGFRFHDLPLPRQLRFRRRTLRMIELIQVDEEARRQLFDRLNTGGTKLLDMEQRLGSRDGEMVDLVKTLAQSELFRRLCPVSEVRARRREYEELVLRFFAYRDRYQAFEKRVDEFLNGYLDDLNRNNFDKEELVTHFTAMLSFVERYFVHGFKKGPRNSSVPRIRFEAISVGVSLALKEAPDLVPQSMAWLESEEFKTLTRSDSSNSLPKVINRIHFVRDNLLGREVRYANDQE